MPRQPAPSLERWLLPLLHSLRRKRGVSHALTATPSLLLLPSPLSLPPPPHSLPTSPSLCSTFIGITLSAAALTALAALSSDCSCRLTTRSATSPCPVLQASQHSWHRPPAAASSHSAYGQCTLATELALARPPALATVQSTTGSSVNTVHHLIVTASSRRSHRCAERLCWP